MVHVIQCLSPCTSFLAVLIKWKGVVGSELLYNFEQAVETLPYLNDHCAIDG